jgi:uncharacterized membrane protein YdjX (TVP38/TMEM64 family)
MAAMKLRPVITMAGFAVALLVVGILVNWSPVAARLSLDEIVTGIRSLQSPIVAPVVFVLLYATATTLALPGSVLTIAGGVVFGFGWGALYNTIGANLGASGAFFFARVLGRDGVERLLGRRARGLEHATQRFGFVGLLALRLIPLVPFNALNLGSGLTRLRWREYLMATVLGILPGTLVYTFFADALVLGSVDASHDARARVWLAGGMFLFLSLLPLLARKLGFRPTGEAPGVAP